MGLFKYIRRRYQEQKMKGFREEVEARLQETLRIRNRTLEEAAQPGAGGVDPETLDSLDKDTAVLTEIMRSPKEFLM